MAEITGTGGAEVEDRGHGVLPRGQIFLGQGARTGGTGGTIFWDRGRDLEGLAIINWAPRLTD